MDNYLTDVAIKSKHEEISKLAIKNIENDEILVKVSEESIYLDSKLDAIGKIKSENILSEIAKFNDDSNIR